MGKSIKQGSEPHAHVRPSTVESDTKSIGGEIGKRSRLIGKKGNNQFHIFILKDKKGKDGERKKREESRCYLSWNP